MTDRTTISSLREIRSKYMDDTSDENKYIPSLREIRSKEQRSPKSLIRETGCVCKLNGKCESDHHSVMVSMYACGKPLQQVYSWPPMKHSPLVDTHVRRGPGDGIPDTKRIRLCVVACN